MRTGSSPPTQKLSISTALQRLPPRPTEAHKGIFGHVLVVGGDYGMGGAVRLCGEAALRTGAGLVTVATHPEYAFPLIAGCPELMCYGIKEASDLDPLLVKATVIVVGSGLGQKPWGEMLLKKVLGSVLPMVVDADALNLIAKDNLSESRENWVLTPHPGEAARLLGLETREVSNNRLRAIEELYKKYNGTIVLKGAHSLILGKSKNVHECEGGNPGMATAGTGDVLAGVIAALIAQGLSCEHAAQLGVLVHAESGDRAAKDGGERGMKASDLFSYIRECLNKRV